jgi:hypothetical protein
MHAEECGDRVAEAVRIVPPAQRDVVADDPVDDGQIRRRRPAEVRRSLAGTRRAARRLGARALRDERERDDALTALLRFEIDGRRFERDASQRGATVVALRVRFELGERRARLVREERERGDAAAADDQRDDRDGDEDVPAGQPPRERGKAVSVRGGRNPLPGSCGSASVRSWRRSWRADTTRRSRPRPAQRRGRCPRRDRATDRA